MSENLQKLLKEAFLNNSFDYDSMDIALKNTWMNSYSYLYTLQKSYVEYEELFYYSNDEISRNSELIGKMYLDKWLYANFDVDYDLIHVYSREEYRRSEFYYRPFTLQDMLDNPTIFLKIPIVMIDDKCIWDYKMVVEKDATRFILPFRRNFVIYDERNPETDDIVYVDHKVQILVIDNKFYERIKTNKYGIGYWPSTSSISIPKNLFTKKLPKSMGTMFCSIHYPNAVGKDYELGTMMIPLTDEGDKYTGKLTGDLNVELHESNRDFYLSVFFINRLIPHEFYFGGNVTTADEDNKTNIMVLQEEEMKPYMMPIPTEDFIIFKKEADFPNYKLVKNNENVKLHYPNIYNICDENCKPGDSYKIFYFYYNAEDLKYTVLFDFYFTFLVGCFSEYDSIEEILDLIYNEKMDYSKFSIQQINNFKKTFARIINYQYYEHLYGEQDFLLRYLNIPGNEGKEPIEYKEETLKDWIKVEPHVLRDYVLEQMKLGTTYHLFTNTIDLTSRIRWDTYNEMGTMYHEFDKPYYVFAMANNRDYPELLDCRVFVDGIFVMELEQERKLFMDYLYIPCEMVTDDSYIEIEVFPSYQFKEDVKFKSLDDAKEFTLTTPKESIWPTLKDIYFTYDGDYRQRFDEEFFDITPHYTDRYQDIGPILAFSEFDEPPVKYTRLIPHTFTIKPNSEDILNIPLTMCFTKNSLRLLVTCKRKEYPHFEFTEYDFNFSTDYIRVFRNGRLLPRCKYQFNSTFSKPTLMILEECEPGEILMIDISPYRYTEIFYQEELDPTTTFIDLTKGTATIDLKGRINKPFDIRYYDVYMNGRKLSINNVFSISPYQITLVNLKSFYNLEIYEKERDWEYFGLDYKENIYYYTIDELFASNFVSEEVRNQMVKDIIDKQKDPRLTIRPNENIEEKQDYTDLRKYVQFHIFYHDELIPKTWDNPDRLQENFEVMDTVYFFLEKAYGRSPLLESKNRKEMARKHYYPKAILLDPDITIGDDNPNNLYYVYPVGHLEDELPEEYRDRKDAPKMENVVNIWKRKRQ